MIKTADQETGAPMMIVTRHLTKYYSGGRTKALDGVDLEMKPGEFVAIMGRSGSGKSTLLHFIAGLTEPTSGTVEIEGRTLGALSDRKLTLFRRRRIGLLFQDGNLIPTLSVEENVLLPILAERGKRVDAARLDRLFDELEISDKRRSFPDALSGGERQRVALCRALLTDPAVLLADEPTGSLDSANGERICRILTELSEERGRTILVVTHEPAVAARAHRVIVLRDGRTLADRSTDGLDRNQLAAWYQEIDAEKPLGEAAP